MSKSDRFAQILSLLNKQKFLSVEELSSLLYVSASTLRRDLAEMSRNGYLVRSRGGAMALSSADADENVIHSRAVNFSPSQLAIASRAASLIHDGDCIFLDSSHLSLCIAQFIRSRRQLLIVTNSPQLILALPEGRHQIVCCSGALNPQNLSMLDESTHRIAAAFNYTAAFLSARGVWHGTVGVRSLASVSLFSAVMEHAKCSYLMCLKERVGHIAPVNLAPVQDFTAIITDAAPQALAEAGADLPLLAAK